MKGTGGNLHLIYHCAVFSLKCPWKQEGFSGDCHTPKDFLLQRALLGVSDVAECWSLFGGEEEIFIPFELVLPGMSIAVGIHLKYSTAAPMWLMFFKEIIGLKIVCINNSKRFVLSVPGYSNILLLFSNFQFSKSIKLISRGFKNKTKKPQTQNKTKNPPLVEPSIKCSAWINSYRKAG